MPVCKVFINTKPVIIIGDDYYEVDIYTNNRKLQKNVAYIFGDYVYIYRGKYKGETSIPGVYKDDKDLVFVEPDVHHKKYYGVENINELSVDSIFDHISDDVDSFIRPEDVEAINNNSEIYTPTIKSDDDFLKYIVKLAIAKKKINLKNYKDKFPNEYALNNMKSGLNKTTKMTVTNFVKWCEILGLDWCIRVKDSGTDALNPMNENIVVNNHTIIE